MAFGSGSIQSTIETHEKMLSARVTIGTDSLFRMEAILAGGNEDLITCAAGSADDLWA